MSSPVENRWPGERLGLPESGPRSIARPGRRIAALAIDWAIASAISVAFFSTGPWQTNGFVTLGLFAGIQLVFLLFLNGGVGHLLLGLRVVGVPTLQLRALLLRRALARLGAEKLWRLVHQEEPLCALGAITGNQAIQEVQAGLKAIYCSGWQVAGDGNSSGQMYPDQSLYPVDSVPKMVERINNAFQRTDEIYSLNGDDSIDWYAPIVADAEAGFGGNLNAFELMKHMIRAGAAGVHFEDQLSSAKKCGHMGGKVLVPTQEAICKLSSARLAADVLRSDRAALPCADFGLHSEVYTVPTGYRRPETRPSVRALPRNGCCLCCRSKVPVRCCLQVPKGG